MKAPPTGLPFVTVRSLQRSGGLTRPQSCRSHVDRFIAFIARLDTLSAEGRADLFLASKWNLSK